MSLEHTTHHCAFFGHLEPFLVVFRRNPGLSLETLTFSPWFPQLLQAFTQHQDHKQ